MGLETLKLKEDFFLKMMLKLAVTVMVAAATGVAATVPQCDNLVSNPLGTCECNEQIYTQDECSKAFWCSDANANNGCYTECAADEFVQGGFGFQSGRCCIRIGTRLRESSPVARSSFLSFYSMATCFD